ncbi:hypothetical protein AURDEDRAFT_171457 [Auricularia subglabra TFB-10046 SS5]|nr:hypothetical protein AURDEDRAFT_171457 [Auricularia subglabra TFB-10046 SS5]
MSFLEAKNIADALARGMENPQEIAVCPVCLAHFADRLSQDLLEHLSRLRLECHAFFDTCLAVLVKLRNLEELARLPSMLAMNRSRCDVAEHRGDTRSLSSDEWLHVLLQSTGHVFTTTVQLGAHSFAARVEKPGKPFADKLGRWPVRVEQLFPDGAQSAVTRRRTAIPLRALRRGGAVGYAFCDDLCRAACGFASPRRRTVPYNIVIRMLVPAKYGISGGSPYTSLHHPRHSIASAEHVLEVLRSGPGCVQYEGVHFFAGYEEPLYRILCALVNRMDESDATLGDLSAWCYDIGGRNGIALPHRAQQWLYRYDGPAGSLGSVLKALADNVHYFVRMHMTSRVCAGPGCTLSALQTDRGKPFPACARCRVPRYCSRGCQRADWKGASGSVHAPHKDVCGVLCKLNAAACTTTNVGEFQDTIKHAFPQFDDADRAALRGIISSLCDEAGCRAAETLFRALSPDCELAVARNPHLSHLHVAHWFVRVRIRLRLTLPGLWVHM